MSAPRLNIRPAAWQQPVAAGFSSEEEAGSGASDQARRGSPAPALQSAAASPAAAAWKQPSPLRRLLDRSDAYWGSAAGWGEQPGVIEQPRHALPEKPAQQEPQQQQRWLQPPARPSADGPPSPDRASSEYEWSPGTTWPGSPCRRRMAAVLIHEWGPAAAARSPSPASPAAAAAAYTPPSLAAATTGWRSGAGWGSSGRRSRGHHRSQTPASAASSADEWARAGAGLRPVIWREEGPAGGCSGGLARHAAAAARYARAGSRNSGSHGPVPPPPSPLPLPIDEEEEEQGGPHEWGYQRRLQQLEKERQQLERQRLGEGWHQEHPRPLQQRRQSAGEEEAEQGTSALLLQRQQQQHRRHRRRSERASRSGRSGGSSSSGCVERPEDAGSWRPGDPIVDAWDRFERLKARARLARWHMLAPPPGWLSRFAVSGSDVADSDASDGSCGFAEVEEEAAATATGGAAIEQQQLLPLQLRGARSDSADGVDHMDLPVERRQQQRRHRTLADAGSPHRQRMRVSVQLSRSSSSDGDGGSVGAGGAAANSARATYGSPHPMRSGVGRFSDWHQPAVPAVSAATATSGSISSAVQCPEPALGRQCGRRRAVEMPAEGFISRHSSTCQEAGSGIEADVEVGCSLVVRRGSSQGGASQDSSSRSVGQAAEGLVTPVALHPADEQQQQPDQEKQPEQEEVQGEEESEEGEGLELSPIAPHELRFARPLPLLAPPALERPPADQQQQQQQRLEGAGQQQEEQQAATAAPELPSPAPTQPSEQQEGVAQETVALLPPASPPACLPAGSTSSSSPASICSTGAAAVVEGPSPVQQCTPVEVERPVEAAAAPAETEAAHPEAAVPPAPKLPSPPAEVLEAADRAADAADVEALSLPLAEPTAAVATAPAEQPSLPQLELPAAPASPPRAANPNPAAAAAPPAAAARPGSAALSDHDWSPGSSWGTASISSLVAARGRSPAPPSRAAAAAAAATSAAVATVLAAAAPAGVEAITAVPAGVQVSPVATQVVSAPVEPEQRPEAAIEVPDAAAPPADEHIAAGAADVEPQEAAPLALQQQDEQQEQQQDEAQQQAEEQQQQSPHLGGLFAAPALPYSPAFGATSLLGAWVGSPQTAEQLPDSPTSPSAPQGPVGASGAAPGADSRSAAAEAAAAMLALVLTETAADDDRLGDTGHPVAAAAALAGPPSPSALMPDHTVLEAMFAAAATFQAAGPTTAMSAPDAPSPRQQQQGMPEEAQPVGVLQVFGTSVDGGTPDGASGAIEALPGAVPLPPAKEPKRQQQHEEESTGQQQQQQQQGQEEEEATHAAAGTLLDSPDDRSALYRRWASARAAEADMEAPPAGSLIDTVGSSAALAAAQVEREHVGSSGSGRSRSSRGGGSVEMAPAPAPMPTAVDKALAAEDEEQQPGNSIVGASSPGGLSLSSSFAGSAAGGYAPASPTPGSAVAGVEGPMSPQEQLPALGRSPLVSNPLFTTPRGRTAATAAAAGTALSTAAPQPPGVACTPGSRVGGTPLVTNPLFSGDEGSEGEGAGSAPWSPVGGFEARLSAAYDHKASAGSPTAAAAAAAAADVPVGDMSPRVVAEPSDVASAIASASAVGSAMPSPATAVTPAETPAVEPAAPAATASPFASPVARRPQLLAGGASPSPAARSPSVAPAKTVRLSTAQESGGGSVRQSSASAKALLSTWAALRARVAQPQAAVSSSFVRESVESSCSCNGDEVEQRTMTAEPPADSVSDAAPASVPPADAPASSEGFSKQPSPPQPAIPQSSAPHSDALAAATAAAAAAAAAAVPPPPPAPAAAAAELLDLYLQQQASQPASPSEAASPQPLASPAGRSEGCSPCSSGAMSAQLHLVQGEEQPLPAMAAVEGVAEASSAAASSSDEADQMLVGVEVEVSAAADEAATESTAAADSHPPTQQQQEEKVGQLQAMEEEEEASVLLGSQEAPLPPREECASPDTIRPSATSGAGHVIHPDATAPAAAAAVGDVDAAAQDGRPPAWARMTLEGWPSLEMDGSCCLDAYNLDSFLAAAAEIVAEAASPPVTTVTEAAAPSAEVAAAAAAAVEAQTAEEASSSLQAARQEEPGVPEAAAAGDALGLPAPQVASAKAEAEGDMAEGDGVRVLDLRAGARLARQRSEARRLSGVGADGGAAAEPLAPEKPPQQQPALMDATQLLGSPQPAVSPPPAAAAATPPISHSSLSSPDEPGPLSVLRAAYASSSASPPGMFDSLPSEAAAALIASAWAVSPPRDNTARAAAATTEEQPVGLQVVMGPHGDWGCGDAAWRGSDDGCGSWRGSDSGSFTGDLAEGRRTDAGGCRDGGDSLRGSWTDQGCFDSTPGSGGGAPSSAPASPREGKLRRAALAARLEAAPRSPDRRARPRGSPSAVTPGGSAVAVALARAIGSAGKLQSQLEGALVSVDGLMVAYPQLEGRLRAIDAAVCSGDCEDDGAGGAWGGVGF